MKENKKTQPHTKKKQNQPLISPSESCGENKATSIKQILLDGGCRQGCVFDQCDTVLFNYPCNVIHVHIADCDCLAFESWLLSGYIILTLGPPLCVFMLCVCVRDVDADVSAHTHTPSTPPPPPPTPEGTRPRTIIHLAYSPW